jgi:CRISPR-associated protein Cas1
VRNKIAAEWRVLRAFRVAPSAGVRALLARLDTASALFELQGMEGWATRLYFTSLRRALPAGFWGWTRQRRPPPDGLNALLSYGYAVLQSRVHSAVGTVGMDPHIGFLHQIGRPRPAFVLDMMEEFRPVVVDYTCWRLAQSWEADGWWERDGEGVRLADEARKALIGAIEQRLGATTRHAATNTRVTVERAIELQVRGFAAGIDGRWDRYRPLRPLVEG